MNGTINFSLHRLWAMVVKEFIQMIRDRGTLAIMVGVPILQVLIFGYAINVNPKDLPTAVLSYDHSVFTRDLIKSLENSAYFHVTHYAKSEEEAKNLLKTNKVLFVLNIPPNFSRELVKNNHPAVLLEADATDPAATGYAISAVVVLTQTAFNYQIKGALDYLRQETLVQRTNINTNPQLSSSTSPIDLRVHALYNPAVITAFNIVPGLIGVVLTLTLIMITAVAITREQERGTMENLLAMPVQPIEVMLGKMLPFIIVGYTQVILILLVAAFLFSVPMLGSVTLLLMAAMPFIAVNLAIGLTVSTLAQNQLQAVQLGTLIFLPSILLSGYMFPFAGMPVWAQWLGQIIPLTHFLRIVRGILLKDNGFLQIWTDLWPILIALIIMMFIGVMRYKRTLD